MNFFSFFWILKILKNQKIIGVFYFENIVYKLASAISCMLYSYQIFLLLWFYSLFFWPHSKFSVKKVHQIEIFSLTLPHLTLPNYITHLTCHHARQFLSARFQFFPLGCANTRDFFQVYYSYTFFYVKANHRNTSYKWWHATADAAAAATNYATIKFSYHCMGWE